ncbi:unnamed protein product [Rotaria sp. Silwood1]|nr:unnamed protein product [Rotaria sp. Silwood1]
MKPSNNTKSSTTTSNQIKSSLPSTTIISNETSPLPSTTIISNKASSLPSTTTTFNEASSSLTMTENQTSASRTNFNQLILRSDLEQYIMEHISSYSKNICDFSGVKGNDEMKKEINQLYRDHRKTSIKSTIVFKANKTRTTPTQQILLKNKKLYLHVDGNDDFI